MASNEIFLPNSNYKLRLTVLVTGQSVALNTTTYGWDLVVLEVGPVRGYFSGFSNSWSVRSPSNSTIGSGTHSGYDFRGYTALTLGSGTLTVSGSAARYFEGHFQDDSGPVGGGSVGLTITPPSIPLAPSGLAVSRVSGGMSLTWTRNGPSASNYRVERRVNGGGFSLLTTLGNVAAYTDTSATAANTLYEYRVRAEVAAGGTNWSNTAGRWTLPVAPSGLSVSRVSDAQHNLSWSGAGVSTVVQRAINGGAWVEVSRPTGAPTSWVDTTTSANRRFDYRVANIGGGGDQSGWSNTFTVYTTPAAVAGVSATKVGANIQVSASGLPPYATSYTIQASQNGGGWANLQTGVTAFPWTHTSPNPAVTWAYRVISVRGSLSSAASVASNTVQLQAPPNAPSGLSPNGATFPLGTVRFGWVHNPVDSSSQTGYELRYRIGVAAWTTLTGTTAVFRDVSLPVGVYEWQVRTKGADPDWSPWSSSATVTVVNIPTVAITGPSDPLTLPTIVVPWNYSQAQSLPQSAWEAELSFAGGAVIETHSGSGATASVEFNYQAITATSYTVRVRAAAGSIWSDWASHTFEAVFVPPVEPQVAGVWDETSGAVELSIFSPDDDPLIPATVSWTVERSVHDLPWELVAEVEAVTATEHLTDWESLSFGETLYRVTGVTAAGAATSTVISVMADSPAWWLSGGTRFSLTARLPFDPKPTVTPGRATVLKQYAGDEFPVSYKGNAKTRQIRVSGRTMDHDYFGEHTADVDALTAIIWAGYPVHLLRSPDGLRVHGAVGSIDLPRETALTHESGWNGVWGYSFTLTQTRR